MHFNQDWQSFNYTFIGYTQSAIHPFCQPGSTSERQSTKKKQGSDILFQYLSQLPLVIKNWTTAFHSNAVTLAKESVSLILYLFLFKHFLDPWPFDKRLKKRENGKCTTYLPSRSSPVASKDVTSEHAPSEHSSSPRSLFLLISKWQNTSMTGWLWATETLRNPTYATRAAREKPELNESDSLNIQKNIAAIVIVKTLLRHHHHYLFKFLKSPSQNALKLVIERL